MGSSVLPQALYVIPRNPIHCAPKKLGFSLHSRHSLSFNSSGLSISRILPNSVGFKFGKVYDNRGFVVRAEEDSQAAESDNVENEEEAVEESEADDAGAEEVEAETEVEAEIRAEVVETEKRPPRKPRIKLGEIMGILNKRAIEASDKERPTPDIRTGDVVEIKLEVPENRKRLSVYKGIVISKQNAGIHTTIRVRRIIAGIGVEIVFPVYSPNIKEIKVVSHRKVRRARLYYLREKLPRLSTFK